jgi:flagellin
MPQVINTNIASLNAQRNLNKSQGALQTSLQRLSSGMRINSAKDDAAGLAISERFTAQIRGLNQAVRNSNDGISLSQTAEGALGEVTNNLQRIRELAVQSANATNSASDRTAMQAEVSQLVSEIDRVGTTTNFNGVSLLDGTFTGQTFQVGANVGETINVSSIVNATKIGLGLDNSGATKNGTAVTGTLGAGDLLINGVDVGIVSSQDAVTMAAAIDATGTSITATASGVGYDTGTFTDVAIADGENYTLTVGGVAITSANAAGGAGVTDAMMDTALSAGAIGTALSGAGITYTGSFTNNNLTFTKTDGSNMVIAESGSAAFTGGAANTGTAYGKISVTSAGADLVIAGAASASAGLGAGETVTATGNTLDVSTVDGANAMLGAIDTALNTVNGSRATLGAVQNRFESVVNSLQTTSESLSAARSRIQDTDFAAETANLTKAQILQQAGIAMMSQANSLPQNVLSLLQ